VLRRVLGPVDTAWLVAGNMIGAGIFAMPGIVAGHLPGAVWCLGAWLLGGVLALAGAAVYGELGSRLPHAGGDYRFLDAAFGPLPAFLTGWAAFVLTFSASAAAMSIAALDHLRRVVPDSGALPPWATAAGGAFLVLALTAANALGARLAGRTTALLTAVPLTGLAALFGLGLIRSEATVALPDAPLAAPEVAWPLALGAAMIPVFFTYSGWNAAAYVAGEVRDPGRNVPRGLLVGTAAVTLVYLAVNTILLVVVPAESLAGSDTAGAEAARRLVGPAGERVLAFLIAMAMLGSANVTLMAGARVYYAMARDGLAPRALASVNRAGGPGTALWAGGIWAAVLATTGAFVMLTSWATLAMLLLSSLTVAGLFVLRRRDPEGSPYRCPGYPITPLVYLATSIGVAVSAFAYDPRAAGIGLAMVAAGVPIYLIVRRGRRGAGG
jgi:APA family basic amino acid/polyamine antiporter